MTVPEPRIRAIDGGEIFDYPIPSDERLDNHDFMAVEFRRYMESDWRPLADVGVRGAFLELMFVAYASTPVGTLPTDERILARKLCVSFEVWDALTKYEFGPLFGWQRCLCDSGEIRLYHPDVLRIVKKAVKLRDGKMERREAERERKRLTQLPQQMAAAGATKAMCENQAVVCRLDAFLLENFQGKQRRVNVVQCAMEAMELRAAGQNWRAHVEAVLS